MWRHLFGHLGLKALSIGIALVLWFGIAGQKQAERALRVPLEFQNAPEHLEMIDQPPDFVDVRVRGPAGTLGLLRSGDLVALLDLDTARSGRRLFHLGPQHVFVPPGVQVMHVQPTTITLLFEPSVSKTLPVVPMTEGEPSPGFMVGKVAATPETVEVIGPESAMRELAYASTETVSVSGASARVVDTVAIGLSHPAARLREPKAATVTIDIAPAPLTLDLQGVPVAVRNPARGVHARMTPSTVTIRIKGPGPVVRPLSAKAVPAFVDIAGLRRGNYNLPVRIDARDQYEVLEVNPRSVRVRID